MNSPKQQGNRPDNLRMHAIGSHRLLESSGKAGKDASDGKAENEAHQYPQMSVRVHFKAP
jgi:hypothetical protein